jgi:hypothetical protein
MTPGQLFKSSKKNEQGSHMDPKREPKAKKSWLLTRARKVDTVMPSGVNYSSESSSASAPGMNGSRAAP